ncbi:hypothetical protein BDY24DRAFT_375048 [Mrakia frigida]|uniref:uncharacterized protein n=1 Tax=Mrakia frigida TaxID=29902 RepID=UPI003FCC0988
MLGSVLVVLRVHGRRRRGGRRGKGRLGRVEERALSSVSTVGEELARDHLANISRRNRSRSVFSHDSVLSSDLLLSREDLLLLRRHLLLLLLLNLVLRLHVHLHLLLVVLRRHSSRELSVRGRVGHSVLRHVHSSGRVEARVSSSLLHLHGRVAHLLELRRRLVVRVERRELLLLVLLNGRRSNGQGEEREELGIRSVRGRRSVRGWVEGIGSGSEKFFDDLDVRVLDGSDQRSRSSVILGLDINARTFLQHFSNLLDIACLADLEQDGNHGGRDFTSSTGNFGPKSRGEGGEN